MKKFEELLKEGKVKAGDTLYCVECVTNDDKESGLDIYVSNKENYIDDAEIENKYNQDKNYKYIAIEYTVQDDLSLMCI